MFRVGREALSTDVRSLYSVMVSVVFSVTRTSPVVTSDSVSTVTSSLERGATLSRLIASGGRCSARGGADRSESSVGCDEGGAGGGGGAEDLAWFSRSSLNRTDDRLLF